MRRAVASLWKRVLGSLEMPEPTRCPYCPDRPEPHWISWASYPRWAQGKRERIDVPRKRCRIVHRTFSLLPNGLLPYYYHRTSVQIRALRDLFVDGVPLSRCARLRRLARSTVQYMRARFEVTVGVLRLPGQEGGLEPKPFLSRLFRFGANRIAEIFRDWKEMEPKHCILGCYVR